jgi:hypothetical protein
MAVVMKFAIATARVALGAAALLGTACSSSTDSTGQQTSGTYYIRFQANGTLVDYHSDVWVNASIAKAGVEYTAIAVSTPNGSAGEGSMNLSVFDPSPITTKTYSGGITPGGTSGTYTLAQLIYVTGNAHYDSANDVRITITEITATTLRGTFQGTVSSPGKANIAITNGEFFSKRS